jgi:RNA polymerase sigma-70 factor (ECF subfamily)
MYADEIESRTPTAAYSNLDTATEATCGYRAVMSILPGGALIASKGGARNQSLAAIRQGDKSSDEQLMANMAESEAEAALSTLYDRYSRTVFGVGIKLLGDRSLAEELVQEVFLKVWRLSESFDSSRASFSTWLYWVTRSTALDLHRKRARRVELVSEEDSRVTAARDTSPGPQQIVEDSWLSWRVSRALEELDGTHRQLIELAYFRGLSQREISRQTGMPLGTVKTRTSRALKHLRKGLVDRDAFPEAVQ